MRKVFIEGPLVLGFGMALILAGCASSHYEVTDPHSGNKYYTQEVENLHGGALKIKDDRTGNTVTIQNSEVKSISSEAYKEGLAASAKQPAPTPTAAPAPAAAPAAAPEAAPAGAPK